MSEGEGMLVRSVPMFTPMNAAFVKARAEIRSKIASRNHLGSSIITPERELETLNLTLVRASRLPDLLGEGSDHRQRKKKKKEGRGFAIQTEQGKSKVQRFMLV